MSGEKSVQSILVSAEQEAAIHARLSSLLTTFREAQARQQQADRDVRDARVAYEQEYALAKRVGCIDVFKHPEKL